MGTVTLNNAASGSVTLTNTGSALLTISSISANGAFTQTNTCPPTLAPGASCSITATTSAQNKGPLTGVLTVTDNAPSASQSIDLVGVAVVQNVSIGLGATAVDSGGSVPSNTISLTHPIQSGTGVVSLSSSNPAVAAVPASVSIAAGSTTSPPFTITTTGVAASTAVTISAAYNGVISNATLTVNPAVLQSLTLSPTSVNAGQSTTANFAGLDGQAPPAGATLNLSSSNPAVAAVPAAIAIAPYSGQSSLFTITTSAVSSATQVTITATYGQTKATATLLVNPAGPVLASLSLSPSSVVGGTPPSTYNNVAILSAPAPPGGAAIALSSSNPAVAIVQANVKVAAGSATSANFPIGTYAVPDGTPVIITASYQGVAQHAQLMVNVATPIAVLLSQSGVQGGKTVSGNTVRLDGPAPAGGLVIALSSSNPAVAAVPPEVGAPAGSNTTNAFAITTATVKSPAVVTISATFHGITQTATLTVTP